MGKQKKSNLISLLDFRLKNQKLMSKKIKKVSSDKNTFFVSKDDLKNSNKPAVPAKIYYITNYLKSKKVSYVKENKDASTKHQENKMGKIMNFSIHKQKKPVKPTNTTSSQLISLDDFKRKKEQTNKQSQTLGEYYFKQVSQVAVMTLMMLFVFNMFIQPNTNDSVSPNGNHPRSLAGNKPLYTPVPPKSDKPFSIQGTQPNKNENNIIRKLSSIFTTKENETLISATDYIKKIKSINPSKQTVNLGHKPDSSKYTGF